MIQTEAALWRSLRPRFMAAGLLPIRIENAAALSLPDCALIAEETTIWLELKIAWGWQVHIPKFQHAFAAQLAGQVHHDLFWLFARKGKQLAAWQYASILPHIREGDGEHVIFDFSERPWWEIGDISSWARDITRPEERNQDYGPI